MIEQELINHSPEIQDLIIIEISVFAKKLKALVDSKMVKGA
jgi:hypothetical protein